MRIRLKDWDASEQKLFITEGAEKNLLGNDILPNLGIVVLQKQPPPDGSELRRTQKGSPIGLDVNQIRFASDRKPDQNQETPSQSEFKTYISKQFSELIKRTGRSKNFIVITYFNEPTKPIQVKGKRIPIHLLPKVKLCIDQLLRDGHIGKLSRYKLETIEQTDISHIFTNRYIEQMPNLFDLIDNVAITISGHILQCFIVCRENSIWFCSVMKKLRNEEAILELFIDAFRLAISSSSKFD